MNVGYIGHNQYRYRWFKSPMGYVKLLLDIFIDVRSGYINISESNLYVRGTDEEMREYAEQEIERIEKM